MTRFTAAPRRALRLGLIGAAAVVLTAGGLAWAGSAQASTANPYAPTYQHPYRHGAVPTRETQQQMQSFQAAHPDAAIPAASANNLRYGGGVDGIGVTIGKEKVYLVFWGSQWGTAGTDANGNTTFSGDTAGVAPRLQQLFKGLGTNNELWSGVMTQYCEGVATGSQTCPATAPHISYPTGGTLAGVWADTGSAAPGQATGHQIGVVAVAAASHFGNTTAAANRSAQYVVVSPRGTHPDGFNTSGGNFCAWHDWNGDDTLSGGAVASSVGDIAFHNMPYVPDAGASCGAGFVNTGNNLDGVTIVDGHEYSEVITDQNPPGGWTDSQGEENADKCAWIQSGQGASANVSFATGTFAMQSTWSNDFNNATGGCQISHPIVGGGGGNTVTVTNPGNQTGTVGTTTSLQIHATDSGGATLTYSAGGLPTGLSINSSTGLISGTPSAAGTFSVTVTASDSTGASGSTSFSWVISGGGGGCASPGQKLGNPGFESGNTIWSATSGVIGQWGNQGQPTHSGTWNAWLDGYGNTHTDTLSQTVTLPAGCSSYTFTFWLHIDTAETTSTTQFDKLTVTANSTVLGTFSNLNKAAGYVQRSFNLAAFAGQTVTLKFTGTEDSSLETSFVVDDTAVTVS
jgi:Putative Ig domain